MQAGDTIAGKYRLNRPLGVGGMASVWSATNIFTEREFAVKFMLPQLAKTREAARRFMLEAKVSGRINHPNIIEVFDVGQAEDGALFLVMELLSGHSLEVAVRREKPPLRLVDFLAIMRDVAQALAAAHRSGVIHRDLKPTNIFLHKDRDGRAIPKVLDFGVSKILEEGKGTALTMVGTILGSPLYMSPEQAMGAEGIDGRTDVFAFGSILFEALCGQRAYGAPNLNALIVAIATTQPKNVDELAPQVPESVRALVRDCMMTDKTKRIASFDPVAQRLEGLVIELRDSELRLPAHRRGEATPEPPTVETKPQKRKGEPRKGERPSGMGRGGASVSPLSVPTGHVGRGSVSSPGATGWTARGDGGGGMSRTPVWIGGGALAVVALFVGIGAGVARRGAASPAKDGPTAEASTHPASAMAQAVPPMATASAPTPAPQAPAPAVSDSVPVISVDSLPVANRNGGGSRTTGRLSVAARPGACILSVDGARRGITPLQFDVSPGAHRLECTSADGTAKTAGVTVTEGTEAHYQFTLAE